jgi:hypothetical protein
MAECVPGANLPWLDYGMDFGASAWRPEGGLAADPARVERLRRALGSLADSGARLVRLWLLGDGRSGLRLDADGRPLGLDDRVEPDLDAALEAIAAAGLRVLPVLLDFLWFAPARVESGVQMFGRTRLALEPDCRKRLFEHVFSPLAVRLGEAPEVEAIDLVNEPEWATLGAGTLDPRRAIRRRDMRDFVGELARLVRDRAPDKPLCVGLASARWRSLLDGVPLDFEQFHWYESLDDLAALARPVAPASPGRRAPLLGEFPTAGASVAPARLFELAAAAGYSGALAWSALASDQASDRRNCLAALRSVSGRARAARAPS